MKIHKRLHEEGTKAILITLAIIAVATFLVNWFWPRQNVWHYLFYGFEAVALTLIVRFFRVPIWRKTTIEDNVVLAPADGVVAANEVVMEDEYFHEERRQISIFMSIYDVHINFFPFDGEVYGGCVLFIPEDRSMIGQDHFRPDFQYYQCTDGKKNDCQYGDYYK